MKIDFGVRILCQKKLIKGRKYKFLKVIFVIFVIIVTRTVTDKVDEVNVFGELDDADLFTCVNFGDNGFFVDTDFFVVFSFVASIFGQDAFFTAIVFGFGLVNF